MSISSDQFAFALHGGAGAVAGRNYDSVEQHLHKLTAECQALLASGGNALDVVETAVMELERSGMYVAGRGSAPNTAGYVELDASIMHGPTREAGAVAALSGFESPIHIARGVMTKTPHVLLAGSGAATFARSNGYAAVINPDTYYVIPVGVTEDDLTNSSAHGTVGAVVIHRSSALEPGLTMTSRFPAPEPENTSSVPAAPYQSPVHSSPVWNSTKPSTTCSMKYDASAATQASSP